MREIERKIAIVTGGGSGIGRAIALRFARAGGRVAVLDVAEPAARDVAREIEASGGAATAVPCDVSRHADVEHAFRAVPQRFAPVDIPANSAGNPHAGNLAHTDEPDLDRPHPANVPGLH